MKKIIFLIFCMFAVFLYSEEISNVEEEVKKVNEQIETLKSALKNKYDKASILFLNKAENKEYEQLLIEIKKIKDEIKNVEETFRKSSIDDSLKNDEGYAFWDLQETTISQLIMEYGSQDYLYVIPSELTSMKISLFSTIPVPRNSFEELIEMVLSHNGIGVKKLNPFLRQLYIIKQDPTYIEAIVCNPKELQLVKDNTIVCYVFSPNPEQIKSIQSFFERFSDVKQTTIHTIGTNVMVVSSKETIQRLVNLYSAIYEKNEGKIIKVVPLLKISTDDAEKIIKTFFSEPNVKTRPSFYQTASEELAIMQQGTSLILVGQESLVNRAEQIIQDLEKQLDDPSEVTLFTYNCKHSNAEEIASILESLYFSMSSIKQDEKNQTSQEHQDLKKTKYNPLLPIRPKPAEKPVTSSKESSNNFVVDAKTGSILMIVKKEDLSKIKTLLKKLDIPKKMVHLDVLLVERKIQDRKQSGINLLKIGSASGDKQTAFGFDSGSTSKRKGLFDFLLSRPKSKLPAFDLTLSFLMAQEDMKIADCPSITAVNQTPATISVVDEISINNGAVHIDSDKESRLEKSFTRAQFGTTITITPTIHPPDDEEGAKGYVTLITDVSFDSTKPSSNERPSITKRKIENEVRVADGETIILGGLRRKTEEEGSEKIPFLGEIPGIGKLFGSTKISDATSEMFIFITPKIINDPKHDFEKIKNLLLEKRAGDTDEFINKLNEAKTKEKQTLFENSIKLFFDK